MDKKTYRVKIKEIHIVDVDATSKEDAEQRALDIFYNDCLFDTEVESGVLCYECSNTFEESQGAYKPDSDGTWLCDDCLALEQEEVI